MADKKPDDAKKTAKGKTAKSKSGARFILAMIVFGAMVPFSSPTLLICVGLLPSLVALCTDTDPNKSAFTTIGFMNLAGVVPFIIELWERGQTLENALRIMLDPMTWIIMFGAAAIGQLLLYAVPPAMAIMTITRMETRLQRLKEGLEQLKAIWGPDVATTRPIDNLRSGD